MFRGQYVGMFDAGDYEQRRFAATKRHLGTMRFASTHERSADIMDAWSAKRLAAGWRCPPQTRD